VDPFCLPPVIRRRKRNDRSTTTIPNPSMTSFPAWGSRPKKSRNAVHPKTSPGRLSARVSPFVRHSVSSTCATPVAGLPPTTSHTAPKKPSAWWHGVGRTARSNDGEAGARRPSSNLLRRHSCSHLPFLRLCQCSPSPLLFGNVRPLRSTHLPSKSWLDPFKTN